MSLATELATLVKAEQDRKGKFFISHDIILEKARALSEDVFCISYHDNHGEWWTGYLFIQDHSWVSFSG